MSNLPTRETMHAWIEQRLTESLSPTYLSIIDNSAAHAGHSAGGHLSGTHFHITLACDAFKGMSKIQQHRHINTLLSPCFEHGLHALQLATGEYFHEN